MSAVNRLAVLALALALAGCGGASEQNVVITNEIPANADLEVLPPDESAATPTDELENGAAEPQVNEATLNGS